MNALAGHPLYQLTATRFREFLREPGSLFWVFAFPILISLALGLAFRTQGPAPTVVAVVEGPLAAQVKAGLERTPFLAVQVLADDAARRALQSGKVAVVVRPGAEHPTVLTDPGQQNATLVAQAVRDALERGAGRVDLLTVQQESVTGVGNRYIDFLLPGVLGFNLMSSSIWGVGWGLVQLRTRKLLKRLAATPMRRSHLLGSFVVYRLVLAVIETAVLVAFGVLVFDMKVQGSLAALAATVLVGVLSFSGLALLTASRAQNSETAGGLMNLVTMPMSVLSGVFFSWERFPEWMHAPLQLLPLTALNDGMRAVINDGAGFTGVVAPLVIMAAWAVVSFAVALRVFRWN